MRLVRTLASFAAVTAFASAASAQNAPAPEGTPPPAAAPAPGSPPPPVMYPGSPAPGAAEEAEDKMRFRWGISGFGGRYFVNGTGGGIGGLDVRLGAQINRMIGVYASPILMLGGGATVSTGTNSASTDVSIVALYGTSALVDFTFSDLLFVAVGPEILFGAAAQAASSASSTGAGASAKAESGTFFGVEARAGLALGSMKPNKRKAFTIGLDLHTIFTDKVTVAPVLALGFDSF